MKLQNDFLDALLKEISIRKDYTGGEKINTIYFGGGTPSLLKENDLGRIMENIRSEFPVSPEAEITFEANPDDISNDNLLVWKKNGINRLSIGIQSFFEEDLMWMNRAHNALQALGCIKLAQDAGFTNMSIDLIYGAPNLSDEKWQKNMETAADLDVPHISSYALTVEQGTALDAMIKKKMVAEVNSEDQARQFLMMTDYFQERGYEHYEISNLALQGKRSLHNSSYWNGAKYLGLGPSAHSFNGNSRQWNIANNALYIQSLKTENISFEIEMLTPVQRLNEYIMTSLRTMEGIAIENIKQKFGGQESARLILDAEKFINKGWMENVSGKLALTRTGKLFADGIASELFAITKPTLPRFF